MDKLSGDFQVRLLYHTEPNLVKFNIWNRKDQDKNVYSLIQGSLTNPLVKVFNFAVGMIKVESIISMFVYRQNCIDRRDLENKYKSWTDKNKFAFLKILQRKYGSRLKLLRCFDQLDVMIRRQIRRQFWCWHKYRWGLQVIFFLNMV